MYYIITCIIIDIFNISEIYSHVTVLCTGQIEASTCPPPPSGIPRAFDNFTIPGRREFDYQSLPGGGEFDPHVLGLRNLNRTLYFM